MKFVLGLALRFLNRGDKQGERMIMREMLIYQQLSPGYRLRYKAPLVILRRKRRLFVMELLRVVIDKPQLIAWFLFTNIVFACLMLARVVIH